MILAALTASPAATPAAPQIRDIAPPVYIFPYPPWLVATVAMAALLLLAGLGLWLRHWFRNRPQPLPPTPREIALRLLDRLREQVETLEPHAFSVEVSEVLRRFIGAEYRLHAARQTSPEFLAAISRSVKFSDADRKLLGEFLEKCDLIKFARIEATAEDSRRLLASAIDFVRGGRG